VTEYPDEQFPPSGDPDVEPRPDVEQPDDAPPHEPDYETEPEPDGGHPLVDETMARLYELRDRPVSDHAEVYADVHERLQAALVEADAEPGDRG
jgi:hypothetical protein